MFTKILIANRGEILARICRTLKTLKIASVAVYSDADQFSPGVLAADEAVHIGPAAASESYLNIDAIIAAAQATGAQAVHPGYGFLSERVEFAERLAAAGIKFIGPGPAHLRDFGLKHTARELAEKAGVPMLPGSGLIATADAALIEAERITYPVMLKSSAGGGGIGMVLCHNAEELAEKFESIARLAANNFGNASLFLEKYVAKARHIEVQIFGDGKGNVVAIGARDCSLQRRNQKVIEETPAPNIPDATLAALQNAAVALASSVAYESAGTVEFVYDAEAKKFYFLEVNTRLQVEHGVTESVFGVDLVQWMIAQAAGEFTLPPQKSLVSKGAAIEARVYAENPSEDFRPSSGTITNFVAGPGMRVDTWVETGTAVSPFYDPMIAKFIATGATREDAISKLRQGLAASDISGIETNADYLYEILNLPDFLAGTMTTRTLGRFAYQPRNVAVLDPGAQSSLQSLPGRLGYWEVGIPPSGPMDDRNFVLANAIVGNAAGTTALELTLTGPTLRFTCDTAIALTGAKMDALLDGLPVPHNELIEVQAGQILMLGSITGPGQRCYLAVSGGFKAPDYLGSTATFTLGGFGGHSGAALRAGDTLRLNLPAAQIAAVRPDIPELTHDWQIAVRYGPHGAPDFFKDEDVDTIFSSTYEVHHNSARTGIRLIGPKPAWARTDGGEAGLHPSNIHDNAYAVGAIDFTGDMPILLGPDGPSLGGFVCPAVITKPDLWKMGQLRPGDRLRFIRADDEPAILSARDDVVIRRAGDEDILIEFGDMKLDFELRLRVQALRDALGEAAIPGIIDLTPGIRSLQIHFDSMRISRSNVMDAVTAILPGLPAPADMLVKSRIVYLPLSWNDPQIQLAMRKYQETTRPNAPWCPDNIEFIRRINGLDSIEDVKRIVFDASYVVLGLGDVYLGAPVATPYDPRHRLVTTKYNPARPWTPQNAVGIGGAYMCIYGMEGPGGYQLFGRTIQMWNSFRQTPPFEPGHPWLLRHFDQIRFVEVSEQELLEARDAFPHGKYPLRIEETEFSLPAYRAFCAENQAGIDAFQTTQRAAFAAERQDWAEKGLNSFEEPDQAPPPEEAPLPAGARGIAAPVPGSVWQVLAEPGEKISAGDCVMIIESMKMEVRVLAAASGFIESIAAVPGQVVRAGQRLGVITAERRAIPDLLEISSIHAAYRSGALTPVMLFKTLLKRIDSYPDEAVFIDRIPPETVLEQAASLDLARLDKLPLFGIPFVVKDNIDVAGIPTTAACPAFSYMPAHDAHVVAKLRAAGAIVLGKANLDQFATGLNGTRSPYGAPRSVFNPDYISGGSSSGSAVAVGAGLAVFSLGTDTAGSGRVPAMFNNLIGLKPSIGRISATGVVPACKSLDCVSVFANSVADAMTVLKVAEGLDEADAYSRSPANVQLPPKPRLGVLAPKDRDFAGDLEAELLYDKALETAKSLGWRLTLIDYAPFRDIAAALYGGVFVAERLAAIKDFFATNADDINDVVRGIIAGAEKFSAADAFSDIYKLQALRRVASAELAKCDALLLPTAPTIYTVADMLEQPLALNARLGLYTNFVNLLDLAAIALPAGFRPDGLPFGITFIGPAFSEHSLAAYADQLHHELGSGAGKNRIAPAAVYAPPAADEITIVVAGAHLSGMVLNPELLALEARLVAATTTAPEYKLFALATTPPKPGLVRTPNFAGPGIAVEVWSLSAEKFGHFVAALPAPMGIGKVTLADGSVHPGFLCEAHALDGAKDITAFGGWRKYLSG